MLTENIIKGQIIELKVQEAFLRYGFDISIPNYNASKYDLIVDTGNALLKIQVKKALGKSEHSFSFACTTQNVKSSSGCKHKYTKEEIDYFATVWKDKVYLVPVEETSTVKTLKDDGTSNAYLLENIFSDFSRLSDEELYNYSQQNGKNYCCDCGCEISSRAIRCISCKNKMIAFQYRKAERPSREELKDLIRRFPFTEIAKKYGVSDNAIRKWCDTENLPRNKKDINKIKEEDWKLI